jgi:hypothetical protein
VNCEVLFCQGSSKELKNNKGRHYFDSILDGHLFGLEILQSIGQRSCLEYVALEGTYLHLQIEVNFYSLVKEEITRR